MKPETISESDDDNVLMLAYAAGDAPSFDVLYSRYRKPLYQFVLHGSSNPAHASEIFQDIWTSVIDSRTTFQDKGTFKAWLYRIARNRLIDFYRQSSKERHDEFDETTVQQQVTTLEVPLNPMELAELNNDRDRVLAAVHTLPWLQREAVMLKYIAGFSLAEISVEQRDPIETVKSRLRYAYTRLRQQLRAPS